MRERERGEGGVGARGVRDGDREEGSDLFV